MIGDAASPRGDEGAEHAASKGKEAKTSAARRIDLTAEGYSIASAGPILGFIESAIDKGFLREVG
jgi:hypothetical protein